MIDLYLKKVFSTRACWWYPDSFFSERGNCASIRTWLSYQYLPAVLKTQLVSTIRPPE